MSHVTKDSCTLEWHPPKDDGGEPLTSFVIEKREKSKTTWSVVMRTSPDELSTKLLNLTPDAEYSFRVAAENCSGIGEYAETEKTVKIRPQFGMNNILMLSFKCKMSFFQTFLARQLAHWNSLK